MTELTLSARLEALMPPPLPTGLFDAVCRVATSRMRVPAYCRLRRCRRAGDCIGPSEPREIPEAFCDEREIVALLPRCAARADDHWLLGFILEWEVARLDYFGQLPLNPPERALPRAAMPPSPQAAALDFVAAATDLTDMP